MEGGGWSRQLKAEGGGGGQWVVAAAEAEGGGWQRRWRRVVLYPHCILTVSPLYPNCILTVSLQREVSEEEKKEGEEEI